MDENYKIYKYTFPDGKIYIGVTKNKVEERRDQGYQHNKPLQNAMRSVGWSNIKVEILECGLSKSDAFEKEKHYIKKYGSSNPVVGYNISLGGKSTFEGLHHKEEHKKYMSNLLKGRKFTDQHIQNLISAHAKERKPVVRILEDGTSIEYKSLNDAAKAVGGYMSNISRACCSGKPYKESKWAFMKGGDER